MGFFRREAYTGATRVWRREDIFRSIAKMIIDIGNVLVVGNQRRLAVGNIIGVCGLQVVHDAARPFLLHPGFGVSYFDPVYRL